MLPSFGSWSGQAAVERRERNGQHFFGLALLVTMLALATGATSLSASQGATNEGLASVYRSVLATGGPRVTWSPERLEVTAFPGTAQLASVSLNAHVDLQDASLFVVPEIADFLSIEADGFDSLIGGESYVFQVSVDISSATPSGTYEGTVHLRGGIRTVPETLKVAIHVITPSATTVPNAISSPSLDRITVDPDGQQLLRDELVIILDPSASDPEERIREIGTSTGAAILGAIPEALTYQLQFPVEDVADLEPIRLLLESLPGVDSASHHYLASELPAVPNDSEYAGEVWSEGSPGGKNWNLEFIRAPSAWDLTTGSSLVAKIGVIDGDFDRDHGDLNDNVDSVSGLRTAFDPGHGTHVAGTICAEGNNGQGVAGVTWDCSLRLYDFGGTDPLKAKQAMIQAARDGARIVNMSLQWVDTNKCGMPGTDATLRKVAQLNSIFRNGIRTVQRMGKDVLWVFAAGNECRDARYASPASVTKDFPDNTITVAAINVSGELASYSNFGDLNLVAVAAPGGEPGGRGVLSALPRSCAIPFIPRFCTDRYGQRVGTSMAAPHVSGLAGLILSRHPSFSAKHVKECIVSAAQSEGVPVPGHAFKVISAPPAVVCTPLTRRMDDDFNDNFLDPNRWSVETPPPGFLGTVSEGNQRLEITLPSGAGGTGIVSRCRLSGDFDVQVDFDLLGLSPNNPYAVRLGAVDLGVGPFGEVGMYRGRGLVYVLITTDGFSQTPTADTAGKLRLVRSGSILSGYFWGGNAWVLVGARGVSTIAPRINLDVGTTDPLAPGGSIAFDNFIVNAGTVQCSS